MVQRNRASGRSGDRVPRPARRAPRPAGTTGSAGARPAGGDLAAHRTRLRAVVGPVVEAAGYDLEDLSVSRAGRRHLLRILVDADGGVSLDDVADLSREISAALDRAEETGGSLSAGEYVLEVGSPGVDRPLTLPRHWRRNVGRLVSVRAGDRQLTGRIVAAGDEGVTLDVDGGRRDFGYDEVGPGRVQIEFGRLDELTDDEFVDGGEFVDDGFDEGPDDVGDELPEFDESTGPGGSVDGDEEREEDEE